MLYQVLAFAFFITTAVCCFFIARCCFLCGKKTHEYGEIDARSLEALKRSEFDFVLIDSRHPQYDDGKRIPGSIYVYSAMPESELLKLLPDDKKELLIIYCAGPICPASGMLSDSLLKLGFKNILHMPGGIVEWKKIGGEVL